LVIPSIVPIVNVMLTPQITPNWFQVLSGRPLVNKEENNANDVAFTDAVGFQEKVSCTHYISFRCGDITQDFIS
jgi:hypothetical protein